jgi:hypothetical protein
MLAELLVPPCGKQASDADTFIVILPEEPPGGGGGGVPQFVEQAEELE